MRRGEGATGDVAAYDARLERGLVPSSRSATSDSAPERPMFGR